MTVRFDAEEIALRREIRGAFLGCKIYCRRDRDRYVARIDLVTGSWCSARGDGRTGALANCLALGREPCPGFPGWVKPAHWDA